MSNLTHPSCLSRIPLKYFFLTHTAPTAIYTLSLHDALPISFHRKVDDEYGVAGGRLGQQPASQRVQSDGCRGQWESDAVDLLAVVAIDRRQARLRASRDV